LRAQSLEACSRSELKAALRDYAQRTELALSSTERRLAEVTEAAAVLLKRIEIAQYHLESMSWWDHLWTMLRRPPAAYRLWAAADGEVDEAFAAMERALYDSSEPGPSERQRMLRDMATAYGKIIDLLTVQRWERRRVSKVVVADMTQGLDPLRKRRLSKA
jgi:hypothetical protein